MAKRIIATGGYVRLELRSAGDYGTIVIGGQFRTEIELKTDLEKLANAARTRLSKFQDEFGSATVVLEREGFCEHCGAAWTETSPTYNGGCCDGDEKNAPHQEGEKCTN